MTPLLVLLLLAQAPSPAARKATLEGEAAVSGAMGFRRVHVTNRSKQKWHSCDVRLPDGKHYAIGDLGPGDEEGVMLSRFEADGARVTPWKGGVMVTCSEGIGRFPVSGHPPFSDR